MNKQANNNSNKQLKKINKKLLAAMRWRGLRKQVISKNKMSKVDAIFLCLIDGEISERHGWTFNFYLFILKDSLCIKCGILIYS